MEICSRCGRLYSGEPAISRKDNKTEICSICGMKEALEQMEDSYFEQTEYINDLEEECENLSEHNRMLIERIKDES